MGVSVLVVIALVAYHAHRDGRLFHKRESLSDSKDSFDWPNEEPLGLDHRFMEDQQNQTSADAMQHELRGPMNHIQEEPSSMLDIYGLPNSNDCEENRPSFEVKLRWSEDSKVSSAASSVDLDEEFKKRETWTLMAVSET